MKLMKKLLLLFGFLTLNILWTYSQWQKGNGPYGGVVQCLAKSDNYIVAGCSWNESGVFVSSDYGKTWNKVIKTDKPSWQIPDFAVNAIVQGDSTDVFYVASNAEGIYKLFKNGGSWELKTIGFRSESKTVYSVAYDQGNIFASFCGDGIYKTSDEGKNWVPVNTGLSSKCVVDLKFSGDSIFAATADGLYVSKNMGTGWNIFSTELIGKYVTNIFINDTILSLGVFNEGTYSFSKRGALLSKPVVINGNLTLLPIALINGKLYGASMHNGLFCTDIPNINWQKVNSNLGNQWPHCLINSNDTLLLGVDGFGIYKSTDNCLTWKESSVGMSAFKYTSIAVMDSVIYAATDINGIFLTKNNGKTWQRINNGLGDNINSTDLLIKDTVIYLASGSVYSSNDKGENWRLAQGIHARSLASNGKTVYAACFDCGINSTSDNGKTWQHINFTDSSKLIYDIDAHDSVLLVGTNSGGPFYSSNNGKSWTQINEGLENQANTGVLLKDTLFFVTTSGSSGVFRSSDHGQTWQPKNNGLCCIPVELIGSDGIIFGTFPQTVIYSYDNGDNWHYISSITGLSSAKSLNTSQQATIQSIGYSKEYLLAGTDRGFYYHNIKKLDIANGISDYHYSKIVPLTNYPNPFSEHTTINYTLEKSEKNVTLTVYDNQGRIVYTLIDQNKPAGNYSVPFDAEKLTSGFYFYSLITSTAVISNIMVITK